MKNISTMVFSLLLSLVLGAIRPAFGADDAAKNPHRLREPEQLRDAAIPGSGQGVFQSRRRSTSS